MLDVTKDAAQEQIATGSGVCAVIVNYNGGSDLLAAIDSLSAEQVTEVVVVDNASTDGSIGMLVDSGRDVKVVETGANLGFGGGANRGVTESRAPFVLICNPDVIVHSGAVGQLKARLTADPALAIAGPALFDESGRLSTSSRAFPAIRRSGVQAFAGLLSPLGRRAAAYRQSNVEHSKGEYVDWVTGACMLVRRTPFEQVGGFDTRYFMYLEEVDLCWRLRQAGWRVAHVPAAAVTHVGGTAARRRPRRMIVAHHHSLWTYARRTARGYERLILPVVGLGLLARLVVALLRRSVPGRPPA